MTGMIHWRIDGGWLLIALLMLLSAGGLAGGPASEFTTPARETRNRANVLVIGKLLSPDVVERLQARWNDEASFFRPVLPMNDPATLDPVLERWLSARTWHVAIVNLAPGGLASEEYASRLGQIVRRLKAAGVVPVWVSTPAGPDRTATVRVNDTARGAMRAQGVEIADVYSAFVKQSIAPDPASGTLTTAGASVCAETVSVSFKRALFSRSTPWAELPTGETRDLTRLLADPQLLAAPDNLAEARGTHAVVYRAARGEWQFNLHSFLAHHEGKFWAAWSSGRVDEDSSSQFIRYATSVDGLAWSESRVLAPDPDGERGLWRWMASGIYAEGGRLFALGSLNQGSGRGGGPWSNARLVRFEWVNGEWREDRVVAEDCVVYFPPLRVAERDFFVWRDSRAFFYTAYAPVGTNRWTVTRMPGPMPDYRMSETGAYVDPEGAVHLIIRDQGYTRRLYHSVSYDAGSTWTVPVKTNYPDAASKNMTGRLSNGWYYLINNPKAAGANARDPLAIAFSRDGWAFSRPLALRKAAPELRFPGKAKGSHSFQYAHAIEHDGSLWVIYATNKEDIEVSAFPLTSFARPESVSDGG